MKAFRLIPPMLFLVGSLSLSAQAREDDFMISNGQGIASPSFWQGLSGQNPAGIIFNQSVKIQAGAAGFEDINGSVDDTRGSGAFLLGNGLLGVGFEYTSYSKNGPFASGENRMNWAFAGRIPSAGFTLGFSGHHGTKDGGRTFDVGALIDLSARTRIGVFIENIEEFFETREFKTRRLGAGFLYRLTRAIDFVTDVSYGVDSKTGAVKPGLTIHSGWLQLSGSYGFSYLNNGYPLLTEEFTGGIGLQLTRNLLIQYQYHVRPDHLLGLTLRLN